MENYFEIKDDDIIYYIKRKNFEKLPNNSTRELMLSSDLVIDKGNNQLIKCRFELSEIIETFLKHKRAKRALSKEVPIIPS